MKKCIDLSNPTIVSSDPDEIPEASVEENMTIDDFVVSGEIIGNLLVAFVN